MVLNCILTELEKGPCRATDLAKILVNDENITPENARQRVSRLKRPVTRVDISLPNAEKILCLEKHINTSLYKERISEILVNSNTAEGRVLRAIEIAGNVIPRCYLAKSSGTTFKPFGKKHANIGNCVIKLLDLKLIGEKTDLQYITLISLPGWEKMTNEVRANYELESIYLNMIRAWLIKLGMSPKETLEIRNEKRCCEYGMFEWDLKGPCYLNGLVSKRTVSHPHGFLVGDISFGPIINKKDLNGFLYKVDALNHQKGIYPFQPLYIADAFDLEALMSLRKRGVIIATPSNVYSKEVAASLKSLKNILKDAFGTFEETDKTLFEVLNKILQVSGADFNLRSILFDFIAARIFNYKGLRCTLRKKFILQNGDRFEFDVIADKPGKKIYFEGKALASKNLLNIDEINNWYQKNIQD